ncbi:hypothetical protein J7E52_09020 [Bacillus sp. ISL-34]|uniref:hypothetical protein n=1 Tax=Bacillus sp. ISL-34 TaxID=2819121 RepID=UPI001BED34BF|nr:hypothetical protein [Bacillus sp. ISL-34]MBT2646860.1 hypothetical protein [Bacillus sp. ISL-34]
MIIKNCKMPLKIDMLEALMRRLPPGHAKQTAIIEDIKKSRQDTMVKTESSNLLNPFLKKSIYSFMTSD